MSGGSVVEQLGRQGVNIAKIVDRVIDKPDEIDELIEALKVEKVIKGSRANSAIHCTLREIGGS